MVHGRHEPSAIPGGLPRFANGERPIQALSFKVFGQRQANQNSETGGLGINIIRVIDLLYIADR